MKETEKDVSLKVNQIDSESWMVSGRGELHLSILIETMAVKDMKCKYQNHK